MGFLKTALSLGKAVSGLSSQGSESPPPDNLGGSPAVTSGNTLGDGANDAAKQQQNHEIKIANINAGNGAGGNGPEGVQQTAGLGKMGKVNKFLGSNVGKIATSVGQNLIKDARGHQNFKRNYKFLSSKGLTPQEIGGSAGASSSGASGSSAQPTNVGEAAKDRSLKERQTQIAEGKYEMEKFKFPEEFAFLEKKIAAMDQDYVIKQVMHDERYTRLMATMGPQNMIAALGMAIHGASPEKILKAVKPSTAMEAQSYHELYTLMLSGQDPLARMIQSLFSDGGLMDNTYRKRDIGFNKDMANPTKSSFGRIWDIKK